MQEDLWEHGLSPPLFLQPDQQEIALDYRGHSSSLSDVAHTFGDLRVNRPLERKFRRNFISLLMEANYLL